MRKHGTIVRWDAARGFGFIRTPGSADVFLHVRDFRDGGTAPREGLAVVFDEIHVGGKGPRAMAVHAAGSRGMAAGSPRQARSTATRPAVDIPAASGLLAICLTTAYAAVLGWARWHGHLAMPVLLLAPLLSVVTFWAYWRDKHAARRGAWRTPESSLHALSLAGGWPGAWLAQQVLRHKSRKAEFRAVYWGTVMLHWGALLAWLWHTSQGG
jgi:uncharacterized membrane protein YsdA (DUF1294 family)/cold shock CspA family protein